jgi:hypothetical protein
MGSRPPSSLEAKVGTMDELVVRYERDDEPNFCGPLTVTVEANGFRGHCDWAYVSEAWLVELAEMLRPLSSARGGYFERPYDG